MSKIPKPPSQPSYQEGSLELLKPLYKKGFDLEGLAIWSLIIGGLLMFFWALLK